MEGARRPSLFGERRTARKWQLRNVGRTLGAAAAANCASVKIRPAISKICRYTTELEDRPRDEKRFEVIDARWSSLRLSEGLLEEISSTVGHNPVVCSSGVGECFV